MDDKERLALLRIAADRIDAMFMGHIPHAPVIEALEETLREEGVVLVNEWESYTPAPAFSRTEKT